MSRYWFDPAKWSRWFLPFSRPLPSLTTGAFDNPKTCIGINQKWAVKVITAIDVLSDRRTWDNATDSDFEFIERQVGLIQAHILKMDGCTDDCPECPECPECPDCPDCPDCPECPEPEPEPVPTNIPVGNFGFTIEEMEIMIMGCINIAPYLKYENGFLWVKDDCCNWIKVQGQNAPVLTTQTPSGSAATTFDLWQQAGSPALPEQPAVQHSNSAYTTLDSLRCAKATALVAALWNYLNSDREILQDASEGDSITTLLATIAGYFSSLPPAELLDFATTTRTAALGFDMTEYSAELLAILDDEIVKSEIICILTDRVSAPIKLGEWTMNRVTDADITATIQTFKDVTTLSDEIESRVNSVLLKELAWNTTQNLDTIECGCESKLPFGYEIPVPEGTLEFNFVQFAESHHWLQTPSYTGLGYEAAFDGTKHGVLVGGRPKGQKNVNTGVDHESHFSAHYHLSEPATITQLKVSWSFPAGETPVKMQCFVLRTSDNTWQWCDGAVSDEGAPYATQLITFGGNYVASDLIVAVSTYYPAAGVEKPAHLVNVLMSGTFNSVAFTDLGVGERFTP